MNDTMSGYAYKVLGPDREAWHGGTGRWARKRWMPRIENPKPCVRGYHLCADETQLLYWLGPTIWIAEYEGEPIDGGDKIVVGRARLVEKTAWDDTAARLFAADCAERVLPIYERAHPNDDRPRKAIEAARSYARGEIDDAAWAAAWAAAPDAARAAALDAARVAALAAARVAARAAAPDAARAAAWDTARVAARAAARVAARAAAPDAARAAAWDTAWDAARDAERKWQAERLREITGGLPS